MPNGKPGDHPYTDIVIHQWKVFGDEIDNLVRVLHTKTGFSQFQGEVAQLLADHEPARNKDVDIELVKKRLRAIKAHLSV